MALLELPVPLSACVLAPCYTFGDAPSDLCRSSVLIVMPLGFIEFAVLSPQHGDEAPVYVGAARGKGDGPAQSSI